MLIQELYDALDQLEEDARVNAEEFSNDGDLSALNRRLNDLGSRSYSLAAGVNKVISGLQFED